MYREHIQHLRSRIFTPLGIAIVLIVSTATAASCYALMSPSPTPKATLKHAPVALTNVPSGINAVSASSAVDAQKTATTTRRPSSVGSTQAQGTHANSNTTSTINTPVGADSDKSPINPVNDSGTTNNIATCWVDYGSSQPKKPCPTTQPSSYSRAKPTYTATCHTAHFTSTAISDCPSYSQVTQIYASALSSQQINGVNPFVILNCNFSYADGSSLQIEQSELTDVSSYALPDCSL